MKLEEIFKATKVPLTLHELYRRILKSLPKTAYSTIYRVVQKFEEEGIVSKVNWKDRGGLYEWANRPHHHHIVCEKCDSIEDIDDAVVGYNENKLVKDTGFIITNHTIEFMGICIPCQKKK
ncbi:transcriptional repressor [Patescibacteria group bacterium]|nr:transcriptional repressor [Patescibacteria group bacterium]